MENKLYQNKENNSYVVALEFDDAKVFYSNPSKQVKGLRRDVFDENYELINSFDVPFKYGEEVYYGFGIKMFQFAYPSDNGEIKYLLTVGGEVLEVDPEEVKPLTFETSSGQYFHYYSNKNNVDYFPQGKRYCVEKWWPVLDKYDNPLMSSGYVISDGRLFEIDGNSVSTVVPHESWRCPNFEEFVLLPDKEGLSDYSGEELFEDWQEIDGYKYNSDELVSDYSGNLYPKHKHNGLFYDDVTDSYISKIDVYNYPLIEERFFVCEDCDEVFPRDEMTVVKDKEVCENCLTEYYFCEECEEFHYWDDVHSLPNGNGYICSHCLNYSDEYRLCDDCEEVVSIYECYEHENGNLVCPSCSEDYYYWESDCLLHDESEDDDDYGSVIREYHDSPDYIYYDDEGASYECDSSVKYLGVELEIQKGGCIDDNALELIGDTEEELFAMYDGSLDRGFEIISMPASIDYHLNKMPWDKVLPKAYDMDYRGCDGGGLHIHVARTHFNGDDAIGEIVRFVNDNYEALLRFARRKEADGYQWARKAHYNEYEERPKCKSEWAKKAKDKMKYQAVNLQPKKTIEFRFFRSTLEVRHFRAVLQFVDVVTDLSNEVEEITFPLIRELATSKGYEELLHDMDRYDLL